MSHVPKVVCATCKREMVPSKTGADCESFNAQGSYYKIQGDEYKCLDCGVHVITGFAQGPFMHHFEDGYKDREVDRQFVFAYEGKIPPAEVIDEAYDFGDCGRAHCRAVSKKINDQFCPRCTELLQKRADEAVKELKEGD